MNSLRVRTNGEPIISTWHGILTGSSGGDVAVLELEVGGMAVEFVFETASEMIAFCETHNFPYEDKRVVVE